MNEKDCRKKGYAVIREGKGFVTFAVPRSFNWPAFILLSLFCNIFGLIGYLIYYNVRDGCREVTVKKEKD